jgi:hypothetical protein
MITVYLLGLLAVNSILLLWFMSPLKTTLSELFLHKILMPHEFDDWLFVKNKFLGELLSCWICCSFWLSLLVGIVCVVLFGSAWYYPIITFFTYPCLCYLYKRLISE